MKLLLFAMAAALAWGQPRVYVRNAAAATSSTVAPGSLVEAGVNPTGGAIVPVDPATVVVQLIPAANNTPVALTVLGGRSSLSVLALVPKNAPLGQAEAHMFIKGVDQGSVTVSVIPSSFGLFTTGSVALAENALANSGVEVNSLTRPARSGTFVSLWGTGLGAATADQVSVSLGGIPVVVSYAGPAPGYAGVDQINFRIPDDPSIPEGCYVALDVTAANVSSNRGSISFNRADVAACRHPLGFTPAQLQTIDNGGSVPVLSVSTSTTIGPAVTSDALDWNKFVRSDGVSAMALDANASTLVLFATPLVADTAYGHCTVSSGGAVGAVLAGGLAFTLGSELIFAGPAGQVLPMPGQPGIAPSFYSANLAPTAPVGSIPQVPDSFFVPGAWTLTAGAGKIAQFALTPSIHITYPIERQTLDRTSDTRVQWTSVGFLKDDVLQLTLRSTNSATCLTPAAAGSLTIPAAIMSRLSQAAATTIPPAFLQVTVFRKPDRLDLFSIPSGTTITGVFRQYSGEEFPVEIR